MMDAVVDSGPRQQQGASIARQDQRPVLGSEPRDHRPPAGDRARGAFRRQGAHHGRKRRRQGNRGPEHPHARPPRLARVRAGQLRGPAGDAARVRALRPRQGQLHRRLSRQAGQARDRPHGHDLPRRSRRDDAAHAGSAAAVPGNGRAAEGRRRRQRTHRERPGDRRHQPQPARHDHAGHLPRGPVLPPERHPHPGAPASRAARGHPDARRELPDAVHQREQVADPRDRGPGR